MKIYHETYGKADANAALGTATPHSVFNSFHSHFATNNAIGT